MAILRSTSSKVKCKIPFPNMVNVIAVHSAKCKYLHLGLIKSNLLRQQVILTCTLPNYLMRDLEEGQLSHFFWINPTFRASVPYQTAYTINTWLQYSFGWLRSVIQWDKLLTYNKKLINVGSTFPWVRARNILLGDQIISRYNVDFQLGLLHCRL